MITLVADILTYVKFSLTFILVKATIDLNHAIVENKADDVSNS